MASTYTDNLRLTKQGTGDNPNTWGAVTNQQVIDLVDEAVSGVVEINCTGSGDITLSTNNGSTDEARHMVLKLTGTPTADRNILTPAVQKVYVIDATELTTGDTYTMTVKPSGGGTGVEFTDSLRAIIYCDGTDMDLVSSNVPQNGSIVSSMFATGAVNTSAIATSAVTYEKLADNARTPIGTVNAYAGSTAPTGWLLCAGQAVSRTTYADLFAVISTTYGNGDGSTTFNLPDLRGRYVAGKDDMGGSAAGRLVNPYLAGNTLGAGGGQQDVNVSAGTLPTLNTTISPSSGNIARVQGLSGGIPVYRSDFNITGSTTGSGNGSEDLTNVPPSLVLNYIIKT